MGLPKKYDPFGEMRRLHEEMDDLLAGFFDQSRERHLTEWGFRAPLTDIEDRGDALIVKAELPGLKKEDIHISVDKDSVSISAERKDTKEEKEKNYYYCERSYSGYKRSFGLPSEIDTENVEAEYSEGVLTLTMKKTNKDTDKKEITIK